MDLKDTLGLLVSVLTPAGLVMGFVMRHLRNAQRRESQDIAARSVADYHKNEIVPVLTDIKGRLEHVEKFDREFGKMQVQLSSLDGKVDSVIRSVEKTADDQRRQRTEDREDMRDRMDNIKELLEARIVPNGGNGH